MEINIKRKRGITVFELEGHIDFETAKPFRDQYLRTIRQTKQIPRVVFNFSGLKFVGSSGLSSFIQLLKEFNGLSTKPRFCSVSTDFRKLLRVYSPEEAFQIFSSEEDALCSFLEAHT